MNLVIGDYIKAKDDTAPLGKKLLVVIAISEHFQVYGILFCDQVKINRMLIPFSEIDQYERVTITYYPPKGTLY